MRCWTVPGLDRFSLLKVSNRTCLNLDTLTNTSLIVRMVVVPFNNLGQGPHRGLSQGVEVSVDVFAHLGH